MDIEQAFDRHRDAVMAIAGVTGTGIGERDGQPVIVVMVREARNLAGLGIPKVLEGYRVVVDESGDITAF